MARNLEQYYNDLLQFENKKIPYPLINKWDNKLEEYLYAIFSDLFKKSILKKKFFTGSSNVTNQSLGNKAEIFFKNELKKVLPENIKNIKQSLTGYPDWKIEVVWNGKTINIACEIKATGDWNDSDHNRRVITSSTKRITQNFVSPIYHLMLTVLYDKTTFVCNALRMDFLQPETMVSVRYEASVSHHSLSDAAHPNYLIS